MRKKSSVITPLPFRDEKQGCEELPIAETLSEGERKEALLKLIRKGAPSIPAKDSQGVHITQTLLERVRRAAANRPLKTPVNTWITEAVLLQLKKEGS